jgi:hypothetical protein
MQYLWQWWVCSKTFARKIESVTSFMPWPVHEKMVLQICQMGKVIVLSEWKACTSPCFTKLTTLCNSAKTDVYLMVDVCTRTCTSRIDFATCPKKVYTHERSSEIYPHFTILKKPKSFFAKFLMVTHKDP